MVAWVKAVEKGGALTHTPEETLNAYVKAFETLDPNEVIPFYELPCLFLSPQGSIAASDNETTRGIVSMLMAQMKAEGYRRTQITSLETRHLGKHLMSLFGTFQRHDSKDQPIAQFGFSYLMRLTESTWRIRVAIAHELQAK